MDQHRLNNLLGLIRNECEGFVLDIQEGFTKDLSQEEYEKKTIDIMRSVIARVDEIKKLK